MQYENAKDILPTSLLAEVQKYAEEKQYIFQSAASVKAVEKHPVIVKN